jgi:hypothetical protein
LSISNEEWNAGRTRETLEAHILTFLRQNQRAFDIIGIMNGLGYNTEIKDFGGLFSGLAGYWIIQNALEKLVREGTVRAKIIKQPIGEQTFYKAV